MASSSALVATLSILLTMSLMSGSTSADETIHLHFYLHNILSGPNTSVVTAATAGVNKTAFDFGSILVKNSPLTEGIELNSTLLGRNHGSSAQVQQSTPAFSLLDNLVFTAGAHNGSSLALTGTENSQLDSLELAVIGGTGNFRLAQGYALASLVAADFATGAFVVEYNVYVQ